MAYPWAFDPRGGVEVALFLGKLKTGCMVNRHAQYLKSCNDEPQGLAPRVNGKALVLAPNWPQILKLKNSKKGRWATAL